MISMRWHVAMWLGVLFVAPSALSQVAQKEPHIGYVYPAGGRQGTAVETTVGGQHLDGVSEVIISGEGVKATVLDANDDLGGTWYNNRYPGARFDSESFTYGYSFSRELLDEWHWTEQFSPQPETLKYLNYVVDKFGLRQVALAVTLDQACHLLTILVLVLIG